MNKKEQVNLKFIIIAAIVVGVLFFLPKQAPPIITSIEGSWDISAKVAEMGYQQYLIEEPDFDYSYPAIMNIAKQIKQSTSTPDEAIKETARYVVTNIKYNSKVSIDYCYDETASSTFEAKSGDCVSMARLTVALLRAQGIPARTMGGCLSFSGSCAQLFAVAPYYQPQVTDMAQDDFKKRGFLHEWVESWIPTTSTTGQWLLIEATAGRVYPDLLCANYIEYGYDSNQWNRCTISSAEFWELCSRS